MYNYIAMYICYMHVLQFTYVTENYLNVRMELLSLIAGRPEIDDSNIALGRQAKAIKFESIIYP